ncbi:hypothetical protein Peur_018153 [Populus x canadensis]
MAKRGAAASPWSWVAAAEKMKWPRGESNGGTVFRNENRAKRGRRRLGFFWRRGSEQPREGLWGGRSGFSLQREGLATGLNRERGESSGSRWKKIKGEGSLMISGWGRRLLPVMKKDWVFFFRKGGRLPGSRRGRTGPGLGDGFLSFYFRARGVRRPEKWRRK